MVMLRGGDSAEREAGHWCIIVRPRRTDKNYPRRSGHVWTGEKEEEEHVNYDSTLSRTSLACPPPVYKNAKNYIYFFTNVV